MIKTILLSSVWAVSATLACASCAHEAAPNDERCSLEATVFLGLAVDTFMGGEYGNYVYAAGNATATPERMSNVAGLNFADRLRGWRMKNSGSYSRQIWLYGESVHGIRSTDINCSSNPGIPACQTNPVATLNPITSGAATLSILRNASSLEGAVGLRYEFAHLNDTGAADDGGSAVNAYVKAQAGFLKVAGSPGGALDMHKVALGFIAVTGKFAGSYLDVGLGRNDVFRYHRRRRATLDARLERKITKLGAVSLFFQMVVDTDLGAGSDDMQTRVGTTLNLDRLFQ